MPNDEINKQMKILGKDEQIIIERIDRIVNGIPQLNMETGLPIPVWEAKGKIEERMQMFKVPGISLVVINDFEVEWAKCFGVKDIRKSDEVTLETLFEAGSASKTFTAVAVLNAVEKKILDIDEDVNNHLISWKIPDNDFTKDEKVALKHLLTHTAGINRPDSMFSTEEGKIPTIDQILNGEPPALNDPVSVCFTPGTDHMYSNLGYIIIQKLYEDVRNKGFSNIMKETIFEPLEMRNSTFDYPSLDELKQRSIVPHDQDGEARETGLNPSASGHGGLLTTPIDFGKFLVELIKSYNGKSSKILSSEMVRKMLSSQAMIDPAQYFGWTGQGFGIFLVEEGDNILITHPGTNMPGATCMMIANPKTGQGTVIMANGINGELLNIQILYAIVKEYSWPTMWLFQ